MRYFIDPFGCVKNQVDAENMMAHLNKAGWKSATAEDADIIIVNSCGFIESAKQESINAVLEWRNLYPKKKILLAGCLAQRYAEELEDSLVEADGFFGITNISEITQAAAKIVKAKILPKRPHAEAQRRRGRRGRKENSTDKNQSHCDLSTGERPLLSMPGSAYVKISEGCNNRCSFCAIPLIRGGLVSRTIPDILEECRALLGRGIVELNIIGQDIGSFGIDDTGAAVGVAGATGTGADADTIATGTMQTSGAGVSTTKLPELLNAISTMEGNFWIRLLYIHPDHFPLQILDIMEKDARFLPYFDIPFQHASPEILAAMNRRGTAAQYLELLETIRGRLPRAVIRSTFLLGFPGETEKDFEALLDFQQKAKLDWLGCFTYSREEGTAAYSMKSQVPAKIAEARKQIIEERQIPITEKNMDRFVGETLDVLLEERIDSCEKGIDSREEGEENGENFLLGRLYCQAPEIDGAVVIACGGTGGKSPQLGSLVPCKVIARRGIDLEVQFVP